MLTKNIETIEDSMVDILKKKSPQERLTIAFNLYHSAKLQLTHYLCSLYPDWDARNIQYEVTKRLSHGTTRTIETPD